MVGRPWAAPGAFLYWGQNGLLGGVFLEMGLLAKNGQNGPAAELYGGRVPKAELTGKRKPQRASHSGT